MDLFLFLQFFINLKGSKNNLIFFNGFISFSTIFYYTTIFYYSDRELNNLIFFNGFISFFTTKLLVSNNFFLANVVFIHYYTRE